MSTTLLPPELEAFPDRYRWTVAACHKMVDEGLLVGRFEVLDGEVVTKMGQKPAHRIAIMLLQKWLVSLFDIMRVQTEGPIALAAPDGVYSEPEPDVAITREPTTAYALRHPGPDDILFVAEVADTSLTSDLLVKALLYARAGIPEYWVLDLTARRLHIHRAPQNGAYASVTVHSDEDTVSLLSSPDGTVGVGELLPSADS